MTDQRFAPWPCHTCDWLVWCQYTWTGWDNSCSLQPRHQQVYSVYVLCVCAHAHTRVRVCVCVCVWVCEVKSNQVKIFFNDGSLNKHFTCIFTSSHHSNRLWERKRERGKREEGKRCKGEKTKWSGARSRALLIIPYANSYESYEHEQCMNKPVDIYTCIHTYICTYLDDSL